MTCAAYTAVWTSHNFDEVEMLASFHSVHYDFNIAKSVYNAYLDSLVAKRYFKLLYALEASYALECKISQGSE